MKKALISAAAAAALLGAGVAQAQVTAYGLFDISVGKSVLGDATGNDVGLHAGGDGGASEGNSTTRFGLKGSTDVGSGIKANFNYQAGIDGAGATNGGTTLFNRQAWAGLSGGFGEFRFGKQDSVPFQTFIGLDYNGASNGTSSAFNAIYFASEDVLGSWLQSRQSNSLQYISPSLGGLTVQLGLKMQGEEDYDDATTSDNPNVASAGLTFVTGGLTLAAAYQGSNDDGGDDYAGFGAQYDFGAFKLKADAHSQGDFSSANVGAVTTVAGWSLGAQVGTATNDVTDVKVTAYEIFTSKEVLKNTYGYAEIGSAKSDESGAETATGFAVGLILVF